METDRREAEVARRPARGSLGNFLRDLRALVGLRTLKRTFQEFQKDDITSIAAGLAYYLILALFPFLLMLVSLISLLGDPELASTILGYLQRVMPAPAFELIDQYIRPVVRGENPAPGLFSFGILGTIWAASGAFSAFMNALNKAYDIEETRPFWKVKGIAVLMTLGISVVILLGVLLLVFGEPIGIAISRFFGLDEIFIFVWEIARWPVALLFMVMAVALLYYFAPAASQPFRWITPGGFIGVVLWVLASVAFSLYVGEFGQGSYNQTYGSIGAVIILLLYLYISSIAILFGAELNATLVRTKEELSGEQILDAEARERETQRHRG